MTEKVSSQPTSLRLLKDYCCYVNLLCVIYFFAIGVNGDENKGSAPLLLLVAGRAPLCLSMQKISTHLIPSAFTLIR